MIASHESTIPVWKEHLLNRRKHAKELANIERGRQSAKAAVISNWKRDFLNRNHSANNAKLNRLQNNASDLSPCDHNIPISDLYFYSGFRHRCCDDEKTNTKGTTSINIDPQVSDSFIDVFLSARPTVCKNDNDSITEDSLGLDLDNPDVAYGSGFVAKLLNRFKLISERNNCSCYQQKRDLISTVPPKSTEQLLQESFDDYSGSCLTGCSRVSSENMAKLVTSSKDAEQNCVRNGNRTVYVAKGGNGDNKRGGGDSDVKAIASLDSHLNSKIEETFSSKNNDTSKHNVRNKSTKSVSSKPVEMESMLQKPAGNSNSASDFPVAVRLREILMKDKVEDDCDGKMLKLSQENPSSAKKLDLLGVKVPVYSTNWLTPIKQNSKTIDLRENVAQNADIITNQTSVPSSSVRCKNISVPNEPIRTSLTQDVQFSQKSTASQHQNADVRGKLNTIQGSSDCDVSENNSKRSRGSLLVRPASNVIGPMTKVEHLRLNNYNDVRHGEFAPPKRRSMTIEDEIPCTDIDDVIIACSTSFVSNEKETVARKPVVVGRKSERTVRKKITFDDSVPDVFEYPSEQTLLDTVFMAEPSNKDFWIDDGSDSDYDHVKSKRLQSTPGQLSSYQCHLLDHYGMEPLFGDDDDGPLVTKQSRFDKTVVDKPMLRAGSMQQSEDVNQRWSDGNVINAGLLF